MVSGVDEDPPPDPAIAPRTAAPPTTVIRGTKFVTGTGVLGSDRHAEAAAFAGKVQSIACAQAVGATSITAVTTSELLEILAIFIIQSPCDLRFFTTKAVGHERSMCQFHDHSGKTWLP